MTDQQVRDQIFDDPVSFQRRAYLTLAVAGGLNQAPDPSAHIFGLAMPHYLENGQIFSFILFPSLGICQIIPQSLSSVDVDIHNTSSRCWSQND